jgi:hypothetical protein
MCRSSATPSRVFPVRCALESRAIETWSLELFHNAAKNSGAAAECRNRLPRYLRNENGGAGEATRPQV